MTAALPLPIKFGIGARTLFTVRRRLRRVPLSLAEALTGEVTMLPPLLPGDDGWLITSLPDDAAAPLLAEGDRIVLVRQRYARRYADLGLGIDGYLASFSSKSRSTLLRKVRKFTELSGGALDLRRYRTPDEIAEFHGIARRLSALTYQEKLLDAGLPEDAAAMCRLAAEDRARGWILFLAGAPVSYLYAPAEGDTLIYAYLGYDPAQAQHSPGSVLQIEAMRDVIAEGRFRRFDFTEGDGQHKRLFATGSVDCMDLLILRPSLPNRATVLALKAFDGAVAAAKQLVGNSGWAKRLRR